MTNTYLHAKRELDILFSTTPDAIIRDFGPELLALCEKFGQSGQSGGSAPFTAGALADAVKKLCLHKPIAPITGEDSEWANVYDKVFQNKRLSNIFKGDEDGRPYFLEAIIFKSQSGSCFSGNVMSSKGEITSRQYIKAFPFTPKTFYIDVIKTEWADKEETVEKEGGEWWTSVIKDESQLKEVFEYYDKFTYQPKII